MLESCAFMYVLFGCYKWRRPKYLRWIKWKSRRSNFCCQLNFLQKFVQKRWIDLGNHDSGLHLSLLSTYSKFSFVFFPLLLSVFRSICSFGFSKVEIGVPRSPILQGLGFKFSVVIWLFSSPIGQQSLYLIWRWVGKFFAPL